MENQAKKKSISAGTIIAIISVSVTALLAVAAFVLYPILSNKDAKEDQIAANEVIDLIDTLDGKIITADHESEITWIQMKYDTLTAEQKALVSNYPDFVKATTEYQAAKDKAIATELMIAIDSIDPAALTADNTQVNLLINKYNALTDNQKLYVTNISKLYNYQQIVIQKQEYQTTLEKGHALANNFPGYIGKWGDFGSHNNSYQGMIEAAVKRDFKFRDYFVCDPNPNYLQMYVSRFTKDTNGFGIATCSIEFTGISKTTGYTLTAYGEVIIKSDGTLYFTLSYVY